MRSLNIAIVGAGWAGLTAGIKLAKSGARTAVFEASHTLGGRARKVTFNNLTIDNGYTFYLGPTHKHYPS
jgi:phytoene dehydrogenase-like protein